MVIGLIVIGDEILSGRRIDAHFSKMREILAQRGLVLSWVEYIGDDPARITTTLKRTFASENIVFCTGGIGATPDDHTRQCVASALNLPLQLHPQAGEKIRERIADTAYAAGQQPDYASPDNLQRMKMGEFPFGAQIIPNPFNKIPGFSMHPPGMAPHYFVPGFPVMAWPMFEWVLDSYYSHLFHQHPQLEQSVLVFEAIESVLTPLMEAIELEFPLVKVFSLPHIGDQHTRRHIDLGVKGEPKQSAQAFQKMLYGLDQLKMEYCPSQHNLCP